MLAPSPSQHLESEIRPHGNPPYDSDIPNPALMLVLSPLLIVPLYEWGGIEPILAVFFTALLVISVVILLIGIETRGRSLEALSEAIDAGCLRG